MKQFPIAFFSQWAFLFFSLFVSIFFFPQLYNSRFVQILLAEKTIRLQQATWIKKRKHEIYFFDTPAEFPNQLGE